MNYPQIMSSLSPLPLKVGGHVPQFLWERRPWERSTSLIYLTVVPDEMEVLISTCPLSQCLVGILHLC